MAITTNAIDSGGNCETLRTPTTLGIQVTMVRATMVPIMNTSPCAKLISSMMP